MSAIVAVGLRPCSGAILVLVFALAQGFFWAGVVSTFVMGLGTAITVAVIATAHGRGKLRGEIRARAQWLGSLALLGWNSRRIVVFAFGVLLLMGFMASERMFAV